MSGPTPGGSSPSGSSPSGSSPGGSSPDGGASSGRSPADGASTHGSTARPGNDRDYDGDERRSGLDRRVADDRRLADGGQAAASSTPVVSEAVVAGGPSLAPAAVDERRSGRDRRSGDERRSEVTADQLSLGRRLRQRRTIISLVLPLILLVFFARALPGFHLENLPALILHANPLLLLAAFAIFYLGFPLRGLRWAILIRGTGFRLGIRDATEIIFISWLVNCLVPAKLGDLYRAYLLKINSPVSLSRTFGTVFIERILDLFAIVVLGLGAGYWSFRGRLPNEVQVVFAIGVGVVVILAAGLLSMRNFGRRLIVALPLPHSVLDLYDRFEEGVFSAVGLRALPRLVVVTGLVWATEAIRLFLVVEALGFNDVHLGISGAFFVALTGSLLTAVPLTPAGIGIVEAGVVGVLTFVYGIGQTEALAITLVDRTISVLSIIVLGSIAYSVSPKRRGMGVREVNRSDPTSLPA